LSAAEDLRATAVEQELREFSYIVSHDLAASFRHLAEFSRLLLADAGGRLTEHQISHAEHIRTVRAKGQLMIEQLLVFSRLQHKTLECARQDAGLIMRSAMMQLSGEIARAGADIFVSPLGEIYADRELIAQVFRHLLDNAIKFHRPNAQPRIVVRAAHDARAWRMQISDNGIGLAPAQRDKAFWMFHRVHGEDAYPGAGSGLALCRRIARRHGGEVSFLDSPEGACVELTLPHGEKRQ
jgi:light-regulated signal transduction histidine kinase (bacteriophytochrome)